MISQDILNILACPVCKRELTPDNDQQRLICNSCRLAFPVREGIPVMLVGEAVTLTGSSAADRTP